MERPDPTSGAGVDAPLSPGEGRVAHRVAPVARSARAFRVTLCTWLLLCVAAFVWTTRHWPLVNDPAQIDYVCYLMDHGMAPYKTIIEMNMPGIYLTNWSVMHAIGPGSGSWRCFDLFLLAGAAASMISITWKEDRLAGVLSASLFALFHGRDGPGQQGQRDLIIAVCLLAAYAFLFHALRRRRAWPMFFVGLFAAAASTIKPPACVFMLFILAAALYRFKLQERPLGRVVGLSLLGMVAPPAIVLAFLYREGSIQAFVYAVRVMLPYYAVLGRVPLLPLLGTLFTMSMATLLSMVILVALLRREVVRSWEYKMIVAGVLFGMASFLAQGRGFPYHRYPFLAFLLLWFGIEFTAAMRCAGFTRMVAYGGLLYAGVLAPLYAHRAQHRYWDESYNRALTADLTSLGGSNLSGSVQCFSTAADCDTTLYRMHLVQATGLIYDYFVFAHDKAPVVQQTEQRLWPVLMKDPPRVIIVSRTLYPERSDSYRKLGYWPAFMDYLSTHYMLYEERGFSPAESGLRGFRIYVRKQSGAGMQSALVQTIPYHLPVRPAQNR